MGEGPCYTFLAIVEVYALRYGAATQGAVLQGVVADLTTADVTAGQEDDLRLDTEKRKSVRKVAMFMIYIDLQKLGSLFYEVTEKQKYNFKHLLCCAFSLA